MWKTVESAQEDVPNMPTQQHYAQLELLLGPFLRYTSHMRLFGVVDERPSGLSLLSDLKQPGFR